MLPVLFGENLFDDFFDDSFERELRAMNRNPLYGKHGRNLMKTDVRENGDNYELAIDLPGFDKSEIQVDLKDGTLTVSASKGLDKDEQDKDGRYIRRERYYGSSSRSFYVGDLRPEEIKCKYESGVLSITVPKKAQQELPASTRIAIE